MPCSLLVLILVPMESNDAKILVHAMVVYINEPPSVDLEQESALLNCSSHFCKVKQNISIICV